MKNELKKILDLHIKKYPVMTPQDVIKLVFQGEFGGGHLLSDYDRCLKWIEREYLETAQSDSDPLYEEIGFGFVRMQISALDANALTPQDVAKTFFDSSSASYGDQERYLQKLSLIPDLIDSRFSFGPEEMQAFTEKYLEQGGGMLSHSEIFRQTYHPAYRVILKEQKGE